MARHLRIVGYMLLSVWLFTVGVLRWLSGVEVWRAFVSFGLALVFFFFILGEVPDAK